MKSVVLIVPLVLVFILCPPQLAAQKRRFLARHDQHDTKKMVADPRATEPEWGNFTARLDYHNPLDDRTWQMRYLYNGQFFQEGGPIFIFLGGEWTIESSYLVSGQMFDMAAEHNGYMFYTEHRFYGKSYPTEDYSTENLKYLTTEAALEDVAHFIAYQKSLDEFKDSKVVLVGKSYSATMATWLREKYPHLVDIAYSSSAPLLAVADFYEYLEVVNDAINITDPECLSVIQEGFAELEEQIKTDEGVAALKEAFKLCNSTTDITQEYEKSYFFGNIIWSWSGIVQYAEDGDIQNYCNAIHSANGTSVDKLAAFMKAYNGDYCLESYNDYIEYYSQTDLTTDASRSWTYQTCTEYGFYQTTNSEKQPFGNTLPLELFYQICLDLYGEGFNQTLLDNGVKRMNIVFGALDINVTKIISTHGTIDPWYRLGVLEDLNDESPTIVITGASHRQDLISADEERDSEEMYAAKLRVKEVIGNWLRSGSETTTPESPSSEPSTSTESSSSPDPGDSGASSVTVGCIFSLSLLLLNLLQ